MLLPPRTVTLTVSDANGEVILALDPDATFVVEPDGDAPVRVNTLSWPATPYRDARLIDRTHFAWPLAQVWAEHHAPALLAEAREVERAGAVGEVA